VAKEYNASDPKMIKDQKLYNDLAKNQDQQDLKKILSTSEGKRFFRKMFSECRIFGLSFSLEGKTDLNEGIKYVALRYLNEICEIYPEVLPEILIKIEDKNHG
jgi:hypothetical protein